MLTTDLALRFDPVYEPISRRFHENPDQFADAFARAWFKLTHRDMGPIQRYLGPLVPQETLLWQDPVPAVDHELVGAADIAALKSQILDSGLSVSQLVSTAWASASTFRGSDKRGGANGARIRLEPQRGWEVNDPDDAGAGAAHPGGDPGVLQQLPDRGQEGLAGRPHRARRVSPPSSRPPRTPATTSRSRSPRAARTRRRSRPTSESFAALEPAADGFRNYRGKGNRLPSEYLLIDRANLLNLSAPEMTVLVGGLRVLGANSGQSPLGVLTSTPGSLTNDFFVNLLDMGTEWKATSEDAETFEGRDRATGEVKWTGSRVDLVFGSNSELRAVAEVYASDDAQEKFVRDFVAAWDKVMNLDRYDVA